MASLPRPKPDRLAAAGPDLVVIPAGALLWRVHFTGGLHPAPWNQMRQFGPTGSRFDHHLPPPALQDRGILYCADKVAAALAEVFQNRRAINRRRHGPRLVAFRVAVPIELLDLCDTWPTRAGGSQAISSGSRKRAQEWSRAIYDVYPFVSGLRYRAKMHGGAISLALYERAVAALPPTPLFDRALIDGAMTGILSKLSADLGYSLL